MLFKNSVYILVALLLGVNIQKIFFSILITFIITMIYFFIYPIIVINFLTLSVNTKFDKNRYVLGEGNFQGLFLS